MDALMDHQQAVDDCVAQLLRPLIDECERWSGTASIRW
jgi:hypothetical protein